MRKSFGRIATGVAAGALSLGFLATIPAASAQTVGAVPFSGSNFHGYATGTEVHLGALTAGTTTLAQVDQAFSGASTSKAGLTTAITSETGNVVQPTEPASPMVNSYGRGDGLEVGLGTTSGTGFDPNQIDLTGLAQATAPPNGPAVEKNISIPINPLLNANLLDGKAAAAYYPNACPLGQPLGYGTGSAADVQVLDLKGNTDPVVNTAGTGTATAQSSSYNLFTPNATGGAYGLSSVAEETVAPLTVNLLDLLTLQVTIAGENPNEPITLTSHATGGAGPSTVKLGNAGLLKITLTPAGGTPVTIESVDLSNPQTLGPDGFLHIPLSTSALGTDLGSLSNALSAVLAGNQVTGPLAPLFGPGGPLNGILTTTGTTVSSVLSKIANVSLGSIDIDAVPHAIGGAYNTAPTTTATTASGSIDLVSLNLALSGSLLGVQLPAALSSVNIANLKVGHLEAASTLNAPVNCGIPMVKTSNPTSVTAGQPFTYQISVPDPASKDAVACDLTNLTVADTIKVLNGNPTFTVSGTTPAAASVTSNADGSVTVTWKGLSHKYSDPPLQLQITVNTTGGSGTIEDTVVANATSANCNGGVSGVTNIGTEIGNPSNGVVLTGSYTLTQPSVGAGAGTAAKSGAAANTAAVKPQTLPFTGAMGGLWQPFLGLGALTAGGGALALARRSRRNKLN